MELILVNSSQRLDIQGLRAFAVLVVFIFHLAPSELSGGFIGVDIFFVISGYLILGQIWRGLENNRFSLVNFYLKRFKRLLPALLFVTATSTICAFFLLLPGEFDNFVSSVWSSLFYYSNFLFYSQSGYFDSALEFTPLLHTWSLSVEEQFYFVFPLLFLAVFSFTKSRYYLTLFLLIISVISLIVSHILISIDSSFSFYASPTRFWQFIAGGLLSIYTFNLKRQFHKDLAVTLGVVTLIICSVYYDKSTPFPGMMAFPVTFATLCILIANNQTGIVSSVFNNRISKYFGDISYSLYLWHWPAIVFYKRIVWRELSFFDQLIIFIACVILAHVTYKFIENPVRKFKSNTSIKLLTFPIALSASLAVFVSLLLPMQKSNFSEQQIAMEKYLNYESEHFRRGECFLTSKFNHIDFYNKQLCIEAKPGKKNILLIGDSHAAQWYQAFKDLAATDETLTQVTASGCKPLLPLQGEKRCTDLMSWVFEELIQEYQWSTIIIAGRWRSWDLQNVERSLKRIRLYSNRVIFIGPILEYRYDLPLLLSLFHEDSGSLEQLRILSERQSLDTKLEMLSDRAGASYVSLLKTMCSGESCIAQTGKEVPVQFDYGHLTLSGSKHLASKIFNSSLSSED